MSRKNVIKSSINVNEEIKNDLSTCLNLFLNNKKEEQSAPFQTSIFNINLKKEPVKYKKNLTDWRYVFSERKLRKSEERDENLPAQFQNENQNKIKYRPQTCSLTKKRSSSNYSFDRRPRTPGSSCSKVHSSLSQQNEKSNVSPFDPSLTPFIIVQNIYESNVNNLETQKRVQTARIRQYYEKKAEKVKSFKEFENLETRIIENNACENDKTNVSDLILGKDFIRSGRRFTTKENKIPIYQRKSRRILDPNEYYRESNKVKIPQKYVIKQYPVEIKQ